MDLITDFEWYNNLGVIVRFDNLNYRGTLQIFPNDFSYINGIGRNTINVRWKYNGQTIDILNVWYKGTLPTPNMNKVIVTKFNPDITTIYNADGSVHKVVEMPYPIMPNMGRGPLEGEKPDICEVYWCREKVDDYSMLIRLDYYSGAWEERYFNPETGEIGGLYNNNSYGYY